MKKCVWCHQSKSESEFPLRNFKGDRIRTATCLVCVPKKSANRKRWRESTSKGNAWNQRCKESETVAESKAKHRASDLRRQTDLEYRASDTGKAAIKRARDKWNTDKYLRLQSCVSSQMSRMKQVGRHPEHQLLRWSGHDAESLYDFLRDKAPFDWETQKDRSIDHTIAKVWYQYKFDGKEVVKTEISDEDMRRCWNQMNLQPMVWKENMEKKCSLPDHTTLESLKSVWPLSWNGKIPDSAHVAAMCRAIRSMVK